MCGYGCVSPSAVSHWCSFLKAMHADQSLLDEKQMCCHWNQPVLTMKIRIRTQMTRQPKIGPLDRSDGLPRQSQQQTIQSERVNSRPHELRPSARILSAWC